MRELGNSLDGQDATALPSGFKYVVGLAALFIAVCSAFFSVRGLGLLFVGSATAVMIMASSLEVGKLVAASFLYRYWYHLNRALKIYMTLAVIVLIGITSLGNYGYLARAYERTHSQVGLYEQQIAALEKEVADTQAQIDGSRNQLGKTTDAGREDVAKIQQRISESNTALESSLARLQERHKTAQERRDRDLQGLTARSAQQAEVLKNAIASEESAVTELNERVAVLDRAVDAYTKQGGPGLFKIDSVKKGQELREKQRAERETIATQLADHRAREEQLRAENAKSVEASDKEIAGVRGQFDQELARLDQEEQGLRKSHGEAVAQVEQQVTAMQSLGQTSVATGDTQIESLYQRIRSRNDEIQHLREVIAGTDIGSYRFVARAFAAPADSIVKWLMLALVIVFDPLAVSLAVGFNVALLRDPRRPRSSPLAAATEIAETRIPTLSGNGRKAVLGTTLIIMTLSAGVLAAAAYWGVSALNRQSLKSHADLIPADSFAVLSLHAAELKRAAPDWLGTIAGPSVAESATQLMKSGFEPQADVYAFAKFPAGRAAEKGDRPVMLCGLVARVTDPAAAEAALSRLADQLSKSLHGDASSAQPLSRSRAMIKYGRGRYMDPEGGFFSFGITDHTAIVLLEFEGDPQSPRVEKEMRLCLAEPDAAQPHTQLPARARSAGGALALWFDSERFFAGLPKNPVAQARYQQLQQHAGFDLVLKLQPAGHDKLTVLADYAYPVDRFKDGQQPTALQVLAKLGPSDTAGLAGRLMDRCADTLDYDSLIARLRTALGSAQAKGVEEVLVEKTFTSAREAQFTCTARYDAQAGAPLTSALSTMLR